MNYQSDQLFSIIRAVKRRLWVVKALRGLAISLATGMALLIIAGLAAHRYHYNPGALISLRLVAFLGFIAAVYFFLVRPLLKRASEAQVARLIEERHRGLQDRLATAVEFTSEEQKRRASSTIVARLLDDANRCASEVTLDEVIPKERLWKWSSAAAACIALFISLLLWGPREISSGVAQLITPASEAASANALRITVKPGTARVPKGSDQRFLATLVNFQADEVTFFWRKGKDQQWVGQMMEPAKEKSDFQYFIFNIQDSIEYFVEAKGVRSEVYKLEVADLPYVKRIDLVLNFPAYTGLPPKTMEDSGDIAALKGTVVRITAKLTGQAKAARIVLRDETKIEMQATGEAEFTGQITVSANTSYHIELLSIDGDVYNGSNEYDITVLEDLPPTVSFEKPGRDLRATSIEEVFTQAKAEDDYGVSSIELFFSVNGGEEQKIELQKLKGDAARTLSGSHTFFLEEYGLKPGDFISYYAKARDAHSEATSDIYFIEIKPFEREFRQAQQQGGQGGDGQRDQNALTKRQKDIIAATFRIVREQERYSPEEKAENYNAVTLSQERLRDDTRALIDRIRRRMGGLLDEQSDFAKLVEHLEQAQKEMEAAITELKPQRGKEALPPEQRALQQLLRADAIFREIQVAFGNQSGGSGSNARAEELADLFELELDKMKNQYETLQRERQQQAQQQDDETKRKLEELARRQQRELEQQQRRMQGQPRNSSGGGGSARQQQELIEETRKAARELERLSRERRDGRLQELARQLQQAADEMQRAQAAAQNNNQTEAIAQSLRALERLEEARRRLQQSQQGRGSQSVQDLRRRAAEAASRQQQIAKEVEELARRARAQDQPTPATKERLNERKEALANEVTNLERDIDQTARGLTQEQQQASDQLREAANSLRRNRVAERIRRSGQMIQNDWYDAARAGEQTIQENLNELVNRLQQAEQAAGRRNGQTDQTAEALDRTRQLADNLESLRRRLSENQQQRRQQAQAGQNQNQQRQQAPGQQAGQRRNQQAQNQQQGQQQGQQRGQQQGQQQAQQQTGQQSGQQGGQPNQQGQQAGQNSASRSDSPMGNQDTRSTPYGGGRPRGGERQLSAELRERLREAEELRRQLGRDRELARNLDQAIEQLRQLSEEVVREDLETAALLKSEVITPLRQLELELSRRLQAKLGRSNLRLADEGAAPERYRKLVEEYYKRLSSRSLVP